jgi:hypothetical protein
MSGTRRRRPSPLLSRESKREPYDVVLIVCEGSKTEPLYLGGLQRLHRLSSANIEIVPSPGQDPLSIVDHAAKMARTEDFDRTFCVFDRDGHAGYDQALRRIAELNSGGGNMTAITSWPCFEMWLLLHFEYTARPFERVQNTSACDRVIRSLRRHIPDYDKGRAGLYDELLHRRDTALSNALLLERDNAQTGATNPSTRMHSLVEYLLNLKGH